MRVSVFATNVLLVFFYYYYRYVFRYSTIISSLHTCNRMQNAKIKINYTDLLKEVIFIALFYIRVTRVLRSEILIFETLCIDLLQW
jgi:hypothetical protein